MKQAFIFLISILIASELYSQDGQPVNAENSYSDNDIVISAQGYSKPLTSTPGGVGILTSYMIMKLGPVSISDAMQDVTGVYKTADSAWGSEISIRGATRDKVVMLIDGSRMNTATDIGAQFGTLNPVSVERIEILKGPVSSLYGSGSIGGVVNVFTRTGRFSDKPGFESGVSVTGVNNPDGINTYGFTSYNNPYWYIFGSGSYRKHGDYIDGESDKVDNSGFNDSEGVVNIGFKPADRHSLELRSQYYQGWDIGIPGARDSVPVTAADAEYTKVKRSLLSLDYRVIPESSIWLESKIHLYWQYIGREVLIKNTPMKLEPEAEHNTAGFQWTNIIGLGNNTLVLGADSWIRRISSDRTKTNMTTGVYAEDTPLPDASYISSGLFVEDDIKFGNLIFNLGARGDSIYVSNEKTYKTVTPPSDVVIWDEEDAQEYSWNGHAGASYIILKGLSTGVLAASGYRAASLEERYKYIALGTMEHWGNPELKPERSYFFEYALHLKRGVVKADASVYTNIIHNLIADVQTSATEYQLQNISRTRLHGAEYNINIAVTDWMEFHNDLSIIRGKDTKTDEDLPSIAPVRVVTGLKISGSYGISAFFDGTYTAAQNHVPPGMDKSESWLRIDSGISWKLPWGDLNQKLFITCTNLLDKEYYDYLTMAKNGYVINEPGRSVKGGYSIIF